MDKPNKDPAGHADDGTADLTTALLARLEAATEGSRELDWLIESTVASPWMAGAEWRDLVGEQPEDIRWLDPKTGKWLWGSCDFHSSSLDAAVALAARVLPGRLIEIEAGARAAVGFRSRVVGATSKEDGVAYAPTPALALCVAIVRAHLATREPK